MTIARMVALTWVWTLGCAARTSSPAAADPSRSPPANREAGFDIEWPEYSPDAANVARPVDPLASAFTAGVDLGEMRSMRILPDLRDVAPLFSRPTFQVAARRTKGRSCTPEGEPYFGVADVPDGWTEVIASNVSDLPVQPLLVAYHPDGRVEGFRARSSVVHPDQTWSQCVWVDPDDGPSLLRVIGIPRDIAPELAWTTLGVIAGTVNPRELEHEYDLEIPPDRARALGELLHNDGRQRIFLASLRADVGGAPPIPDSILVRSSRDGDPRTLGDDLEAGTGLLVYGEANDQLAVALYERGTPPTVQTLAIAPADLARWTDTLTLALAGSQAMSRAPTPRGLTRFEPEVVPTTESPARLLAGHLVPAAIQERLAGLERVIVVPIRSLGRLPWAALEVAGKPLVATHAITVAPDLGLLALSPEPWARRFERPLVVGDPHLGSEAYPDWQFPDLPGAAAEAEAVAAALETAPLLGADATREAVVERASNADLIYLATHGVADRERPLYGSFVALARGGWNAGDVLASDLQAKLVVLSACQTGLGMDVGGGTIGLARSFYLSGAPRVVMSLWNVDDDGTKELMGAFFEHLRDVPPAEALRRAADELRQSGAPPAVWASFSILGSPR